MSYILIKKDQMSGLSTLRGMNIILPEAPSIREDNPKVTIFIGALI
jgi:hypothetical protein